MTKEEQQQEHLDWIADHTIFECVAGSHAYGNSTPESDIDYRSIVVPPSDFYDGIRTFEQKIEWPDGEDRVAVGITKLLVKLQTANPTLMELLWMPEDAIKYITPLYRELRAHRDMFLTLKCRESYHGYARSQLGRIKRHKAWMDAPPVKPTRADFKLDDAAIMSNELLMKLSDLYEESVVECEGKGDFTRVDTPLLRRLNAERNFAKAKKVYKEYQDWLKNRNPTRAALEAKYGYDTKHASHLVRLMLQARGIAERGELMVRLEGYDLAAIKDVRAGVFAYESMLSMADDMGKDVDDAFAKNPQNLPERCDMDAVIRLNRGMIDSLSWRTQLYKVGKLSY